MICAASLCGQTPPVKWHAEWIASPGAPERDAGVFYFRKEVTLPAVPSHFLVYVSADNRFLLHVNGSYAGEGPARGDLFHWRYEVLDLAPLLHIGKNVIAATVWNFGLQAPVAQMSNRTGFLLQGASALEEVADTDATWLVYQEHGRATNNHEGAHGYYAAGPAERIDGRMLDWTWDQPEVDVSRWQAARAIGHGAVREVEDADNPWELVKDLLPPMEHRLIEAGEPVRVDGLSSLPAFPAKPLEIPANSHVTLLLDHRVLQTAYPELIASGGRDAVIHLTYSEALYDAKGDKGNRNEIEGRHIDGITDEYIADGGAHRAFQPLWWRTWRYLQLDITTRAEPLHLEGLHAWFSAYPFEERAKIDGDISDLKALWSTGWRTARLCAHETYMDAPYWEQLQYVGDTRIQALISYAMSGDSRLARQAITNIDASRMTDGLTQSRFPSGLPQVIPPFSLLWVNMLHDYWMYVDDEPLVRETLPHTRTVLDWFTARLRPDGLLGQIPWWPFGDWTATYPGGSPPQEADGGSTFLTLQFIQALRDAAELEAKYGSAERAAQYRDIIRRASDALNRSNWDGRYGLYADTPAKQTYSQEANVLAVANDVAPASQQAAILRRVMASQEKTQATLDGQPVPPMSPMSFYFRFYLSRALEQAGIADSYLDQLGPWRGMLQLGLSTWAETPEPTRSDCHAWSASPNYDLLTIVAGIQPASPGFRSVRIAPHLGGLKHLEASMPHGTGEIETRYVRQGSNLEATITLPEGLNGEFVWAGKSYPLHSGRQVIKIANEIKAGTTGDRLVQ
jgi:alpha-L-rhamnosidase